MPCRTASVNAVYTDLRNIIQHLPEADITAVLIYVRLLGVRRTFPPRHPEGLHLIKIPRSLQVLGVGHRSPNPSPTVPDMPHEALS